MFDTIRQIFEKNETLLTVTENVNSSARCLVTKMVNALTAKLEIGSPMASMYLLGNPDHYTSHNFINFHWKSYVREARSVFSSPLEEIDDMPEKVLLNKNKEKYVALSKVHDYIYRPSVFGSITLYDWIRCANKKRKASKHNKETITEDIIAEHEDDGNNSDFSDELNIVGNSFIGGGINVEINDSESDWIASSDEIDDELNIENVQNTNDDIPFHSFLLIKFNVHLCQILMSLTSLEVHYHDVIRVIMSIIVQQC